MTIAHELFHRLTITLQPAILSASGYDITDPSLPTSHYGHRLSPCPRHLMCPFNNPANRELFTSGIDGQHRDDDLANTYGSNTPGDGNFGMSLILPDNGVLP